MSIFYDIVRDLKKKNALKKCKQTPSVLSKRCLLCEYNESCVRLEAEKERWAEKCPRKAIANQSIMPECYACMAKEKCKMFKELS